MTTLGSRSAALLLVAVALFGGGACSAPAADTAIPGAATASVPVPTGPSRSVAAAGALRQSVLPKPALPEAAKQNDDPGQTAFIEYWFDTFDYAIATGDKGPLMSAAAPDCVSCAQLTGAVDEIYGVGGHVEGGLHRVDSINPMPVNEVGVASPTVSFSQEAAVDVYPDGRRVETPARESTFAMILVFEDAGWHFFGFGSVQ